MPSEFIVQTPSNVVKRLLLLSWVLLFVCLLVALEKQRGPLATVDSLRIDPNTAPWWELTVLPDVGPVLAREIVEYRERERYKRESQGRRVFETLADMDAVKGIGPKRLVRLESFLDLAGPRGSGEPYSAQPVQHDRNAQ